MNLSFSEKIKEREKRSPQIHFGVESGGWGWGWASQVAVRGMDGEDGDT